MKRRRVWIGGGLGFVLLLAYYFSLPTPLFDDPYSTVLEDREGILLSASIAKDGQWRFPVRESIPEKFKHAIVTFEDKRFYQHIGVDPLAMGRALGLNVRAKKIISGGSTLTMQVVRMMRKGKPRTFFEKAIEIILATRLEFRFSKDEILSLYAAHAPFGGNVVGLEAACWRYYARPPDALSWGEAATLAVLPNAPSLMHPGKNRELLLAKRDRLLDKLLAFGHLDTFSCVLAKEEPLPEEPKPLPRYARHLLTRGMTEGHAQEIIRSTLSISYQQRVEQILADHHRRLRNNHIQNAGALVLEVRTGHVVAYVGNVTHEAGGAHGHDVDMVMAPRSTGSILKPFLYAAMLDEGKILPHTLLPDVPTIIHGFAPKNFSKEYDGAVPADKALIRSLNVPAVYLLRDFRQEKFYSLLQELGMTTLRNPSQHYGLSLILGGAEGNLWEISGMYASLARELNNYFLYPGKGRYDPRDIHPPYYRAGDSLKYANMGSNLTESARIRASAVYLTFEMLKEVYRPGEESGWKYFNSSKKIAWKTGTSFGFRDAWAIGANPDYVVGIWAGNADGEGRPGLTGTEAASPILFDVFSMLPGHAWFSQPLPEMEAVTVCSQSGHRNTTLCGQTDTLWTVKGVYESPACPYHKKIHLSADGKYQVHSGCTSVREMVDVPWFVLPPVQEYYYSPKNISYRSLPPFRKDCQHQSSVVPMDLIYPRPGSRIFIPRQLNGELGSAVFEVAHHQPRATVFWHLDGNYVGSTVSNHHINLSPKEGKHLLTVMDGQGFVLEREFEVLSKGKAR